MYFFVTLTFSLSGRDVEMPKFLNKTIGPLAVTCRTNLAQHFYCVLQFPHYLRLFFVYLSWIITRQSPFLVKIIWIMYQRANLKYRSIHLITKLVNLTGHLQRNMSLK